VPGPLRRKLTAHDLDLCRRPLAKHGRFEFAGGSRQSLHLLPAQPVETSKRNMPCEVPVRLFLREWLRSRLQDAPKLGEQVIRIFHADPDNPRKTSGGKETDCSRS